jgi:hypothetical protein
MCPQQITGILVPSTRPPMKDRPMDRRERSDLLERLVVYRRVYHLRSDYDARPLLSVRAAMAHGERMMRASRLAAALTPAT